MSEEENRDYMVMTVGNLKQILFDIEKGAGNGFEIWLSSDEEGNEFHPMLQNASFSLAVDKSQKRVVLYPAHR